MTERNKVAVASTAVAVYATGGFLTMVLTTLTSHLPTSGTDLALLAAIGALTAFLLLRAIDAIIRAAIDDMCEDESERETLMDSQCDTPGETPIEKTLRFMQMVDAEASLAELTDAGYQLRIRIEAVKPGATQGAMGVGATLIEATTSLLEQVKKL